ncbi:MAG: fimbrillin family protein [Prevotella sp.]|nr:fimbrillin family protein [Prevotella sp.]
MKLSRFLIIAIAASTSFLTACTSEEEETSARHELVFQLGMGNAETRATPEGTWTVDDYIAIKVGNTVKKYKITSPDGKAKGIDTDNTFYWEDFDESTIKVTAWSFGSDYYETVPDIITVKTDQSSDKDYTSSDFLYAKETTITKGETPSLTFYHQMSYLGFLINLDEPVEINSVVFGEEPEWNDEMCYIKANYSEPTEDATGAIPNIGTFDVDYDDEDNLGSIIAHKGDEDERGQLYSVILVPFEYYESIPVIIHLEGGIKFSFWLGMDVASPQCQAGASQFYIINIRNKKLSVSSATGQAVSAANWEEQV